MLAPFSTEGSGVRGRGKRGGSAPKRGVAALFGLKQPEADGEAGTPETRERAGGSAGEEPCSSAFIGRGSRRPRGLVRDLW
eukprot:scaffold7039_cov255-Pinguiococcus_pyrenoidosus.AAC.7